MSGLRNSTLESHDLQHTESERNRIGFVRGGNLGDTRPRTEEDIEQIKTSTRKAERRYLHQILCSAARAAGSEIPPHDGSENTKDMGKVKIGIAFPTACGSIPNTAITEPGPGPTPPVSQSPATETTKTVLKVSWWDMMHKDHLPDRIRKKV